MTDSGFHNIEEIIEDIRLGKMVILVDDEDRENEGDLIIAASHITTEAVNFMVTQARGLLCLALTPEQVDRLQIPPMIRDDLNGTPNKTAFTVSIEAAEGITTGISAPDRARTIRAAANPSASSADIRSPGHIFPLRAKSGGVLKRAGHTEASIDLARLAGLTPAAAICEVMNTDGEMARVPDLKKFSTQHGIKLGTIADLIEYRLRRENLVEEVFSCPLPSLMGDWKARAFRSHLDGSEHLVLQMGEVKAGTPTLVRVHVDNYNRELFHMLAKGESDLRQSLEKIRSEGAGLFLLLRGNNQSGGLVAELQSLCGERAQPLMDNRDYGIGAQILRALGAHQIKLITNKLERRVGLKAFDLEIVDVVPLKEGHT